MSEQIQVRAGWWRQRCGHVACVIPAKTEMDFCWVDGLRVWYRDNGTVARSAMPEDLVEFLGEQIVIGQPDSDPLATIRAIVHDVPEASRMDVVWELRRLEEWLCRQMQEDTE